LKIAQSLFYYFSKTEKIDMVTTLKSSPGTLMRTLVWSNSKASTNPLDPPDAHCCNQQKKYIQLS